MPNYNFWIKFLTILRKLKYVKYKLVSIQMFDFFFLKYWLG